ncbi:Protein fantom-like [Oopsacas minuta]|uniref:Protein fantom-like n=1 Tax=Oopsacas minuta TaxID=111878 RepID=A0AAV7JQI5_9METZ|nr:Protein fantom-like [Oopsacas minuta]
MATAPVRKRNIYKESQMISKLSRSDLEDKHLRLLQEFELVKKESLAQEDKCKHLFVQMNKLKTLQSKLAENPAQGKAGNPQLYNMIENLQSKVTELEIKNEKLENKLQLSKLQTQASSKRKLHNTSRMDKSSSEPAQYTSQQPHRYGHSLLEQARQDNQKLEEYVLYLKTEIKSVENTMATKDREHEQACRNYEQRIYCLKEELNKSHGLYEIVTSKENVDILRLKRDLLEKTNQLDTQKAEYSSLQNTLERMRGNHSNTLGELEYSNNKLREEMKHSTELLEKVRGITMKNLNMIELQHRIGEVSAENKVLKESNEDLMKNALDESHEEEINMLQNKLDKVELDYRADLLKMSESMEELQTERIEREKFQNELSELQTVYSKIKEEHQEMEGRLSFLKEQSITDWRDIEAAVAHIRSKKDQDPGEIEHLKTELLETKSSQAEVVLELDKTHKLLEIQHKISKAERDKIDNMSVRLEDVRAEYEHRISEYVQLLDFRAQKIRKLETKLRDIAYGTKKYRLRLDDGVESEEEGTPDEEVELQRGYNLLEIHLTQLSLHSEVLERLGRTEPHLFLSYDFFEYETEMTTVTKGFRPIFNFRSNFVIKVDDFFLDYVMKQTVPIEIYQTQGLEYELVAKGHLDLKSLLHDHGSSKIPCTAVATGAGDYHDVIQFGTLEYWLRIRLPVREAFHLYQDRTSAMLAIGEDTGEKMTFETEFVNELVIKVLSCEDLVSRRQGMIPSSYVMYKFYEYPDHDTDIIPSSSHPHWNDVRKFPVTMDRNLDQYLKIEYIEVYVFDDTDPDLKQYLGLAKLPLISLVSSSCMKGAYPLMNSSGGSVGTINMNLSWTKSYLPVSSGEIVVPADIPPPLEVQTDSDPERDSVQLVQSVESVESAVPYDRDIDSEIEEELMRHTITLSTANSIHNTNSHTSVVSALDTMSTQSNNIDVVSKQTRVEDNIPSPVISDHSDVLIDGLIAEMETDNSLSLPLESIASISLPATPPTEPDILNKEFNTLKSTMNVSMTIDSLSTFQPSAYFTILLHSLTAVSDINQGLVGNNLIYIDYEFLNYDIEELETPNSIPIPKPGDSVLFNFKKMFDFQSSPDSENKKKMLQGMLLDCSGSASSTASIKFTLVTDPQGDDQNCEELGCAYLDLMQVVNTEFNNISADLPVFRLSSPGSIIANLTVHLLEINMLREFADLAVSENIQYS